jgi:S-adenosylmethionine:tRNA ribosyltransferase-isomerase
VLPAAATARILAPYAGARLWLAHVDLSPPLETYLTEYGHPIRYDYVPRRWPLSAYRNVYADEPGSAEMPSAGRPFTPELITRLVRALETVSQPDGTVAPDEGWTNFVVTPERGLWAIDGLLSGLHEPESSHLDVLRAAAGEALLERSYDAAREHGYRWHEFGDSQLILP